MVACVKIPLEDSTKLSPAHASEFIPSVWAGKIRSICLERAKGLMETPRARRSGGLFVVFGSTGKNHLPKGGRCANTSPREKDRMFAIPRLPFGEWGAFRGATHGKCRYEMDDHRAHDRARPVDAYYI